MKHCWMLLLVVAVWLSACSSSSGDPQDIVTQDSAGDSADVPAVACEPGITVACECEGLPGVLGEKTCNETGDQWTPCDGCLDPCETVNCSEHGECQVSNGEALCLCDEGYEADGLLCNCVPQCQERECGEDGCGGSCGACEEGTTCEEGTCEAIPPQPDCDGKKCGDDGLGGSCGECREGADCVDFQCECDNHTGKGCVESDAYWLNSCGDTQDLIEHCDYGCLDGDCLACVPDCIDKTCGSDGCDGICGMCSGNKACVDGLCICAPENDTVCDGFKLYWVDSCGEVGDLKEWCTWGCEEGECTACPPQCDGKECGPDLCGGTCGECDSGLECISSLCIDPTQPQCDGKECGPDGTGGLCGLCVEPETCIVDQCIIVVPDGWTCDDANYASLDGCHCNCGIEDLDCDDPEAEVMGCQEGQLCIDAECVTPVPVPQLCGDVFSKCGPYCGEQDLDCIVECAQSGPQAVADLFLAVYQCVLEACGDLNGWCIESSFTGACAAPYDACIYDGCIPDCEGKVCGDNGCGDVCGTCEEHEECQAGLCVQVPWCGDGSCSDGETCSDCPLDCGCGCGETCVDNECAFTACDDRECGSDGCDGTCGTCELGLECSLEGLCVPLAAACAAGQAIQCGETLSGSNEGVANTILEYGCGVPWQEVGGEVVYSFVTSTPVAASFKVEPLGGSDLDVIILVNSCNPLACIDHADTTASVEALPETTYFIVVDAFIGIGGFTLKATCTDLTL